MLTPVDLETMVFRRSMRGYNTEEVQEFMTRITHDYERLYRENIDLKEAVEARDAQLEKYKAIEDTMRNAMLLAQSTAEETKNCAKREAELVVNQAEQHGENIRARVNEEIKAEIQKLAILKNQVDYFKAQFKSFLGNLLEITDNKLDLSEKLEQEIKNGEELMKVPTNVKVTEAPKVSPSTESTASAAEVSAEKQISDGAAQAAATTVESTPRPQQFIDKTTEIEDEDDFDFGSVPRPKTNSFFMQTEKKDDREKPTKKTEDDDFEKAFSFFDKK